jgi:hypothetical protein
MFLNEQRNPFKHFKQHFRHLKKMFAGWHSAKAETFFLNGVAFGKRLNL